MTKTPRRPNILFVMADQLTALATSPYGNRGVLTPHMQRLADRGTTFDHVYCNSPLCGPSRASLMTGRLSSRLPVNDNAEELPASAPTFVHHLRRAGYLTCLSGKMHFVGPDQLHGFEERLTTDIYPADYLWTKYWPSQGDPPRRVGAPGDAAMAGIYEQQMAQRVKEAGPVATSLQLDYDEEVHFRATERLRHLARRRGTEAERPWFLCVSYTHPHDPYVALGEYWDRYDGREIAMPEEPPPGYVPHATDIWVTTYHGVDRVSPTREDVSRSRRGYYANTSYIDDKLGALVDEVGHLGMAGDTVIIFTSDHGDQIGEHGMWFKRIYHEHAVRVPLIVVGPGIHQGRRVRENISLVDLFPTFLELGLVKEPPDAERFLPHLDGQSVAPFLRGEEHTSWSDRAIIENNSEGTIKPIRALIAGRHKFVYVHERPDQLFDLNSDPNEWRNVMDEPAYREIATRLRAEVLVGWDPAEEERRVLASQLRRIFLKEALYQGQYAPWDYQPVFDATRTYVRRERKQ